MRVTDCPRFGPVLECRYSASTEGFSHDITATKTTRNIILLQGCSTLERYNSQSQGIFKNIVSRMISHKMRTYFCIKCFVANLAAGQPCTRTIQPHELFQIYCCCMSTACDRFGSLEYILQEILGCLELWMK